MRRELGSAHSAVKTAAAWTGANERTVKNWFAGRGGPSGHRLAGLAHHSDEVLCAFLSLAGRDEVLAAKRLIASARRHVQIHGVVQDSTDADDVPGDMPVRHDVPRSVHSTRTRPSPRAAVARW